MKFISVIKIFFCSLAVIAIGSCSTSQKFTINGTPGDKIFIPTLESANGTQDPIYLGEIPYSGSLKVKLADEYYHPFLLSQSANSNVMVPFALNSKNKNVGRDKFLERLGWILFPCGVLPGFWIGYPASERLQQGTYQNQIKYLPDQQTNSDLTITAPSFSNDVVIDNSSTKRRGKASESPDSKKQNKSESQSSDVANRKLKDATQQIAATYYGEGNLSDNNGVVEKYDDIQIVIKRVSKDKVSVSVIESDEDFFGREAIYSVKANDKGEYILTHNSIPDVSLTIDKNGTLKYKHFRVNIDDEIYILTINASK